MQPFLFLLPEIAHIGLNPRSGWINNPSEGFAEVTSGLKRRRLEFSLAIEFQLSSVYKFRLRMKLFLEMKRLYL